MQATSTTFDMMLSGSAVNPISMMPILLLPFWTVHRWMTGLHGRSGIFTRRDHPNRKLSGLGPISGEQEGVKVR